MASSSSAAAPKGNQATGAAAFFIKGLNLVGDGLSGALDIGARLVSNTIRTVAPTALGAVGGYLIDASPQKCALQAFVGSQLASNVLVPVGRKISQYTGEGDGQIHKNAARLLYVIGSVGSIAVPVFVTYNYGEQILSTAEQYVPEFLGFLVRQGKDPYTIYGGLASIVAPAVAQGVIESLYTVEAKTKKA